MTKKKKTSIESTESNGGLNATNAVTTDEGASVTKKETESPVDVPDPVTLKINQQHPDNHGNEEVRSVEPSRTPEQLDEGISSASNAEVAKTEVLQDSKLRERNTKEPEQPIEVKPLAKKKLSLQERLALAAKSGKPKRVVSSVKEEAKILLESSEPNSRTSSLPPSREASLDLSQKEAGSTAFPLNFIDLSKEEQEKVISQFNNKLTILESKNKSLSAEKESLQEKIKGLTLSQTSTHSSSASQELLKQKDAKIAQLIKEGESLSLKELKYTNTIKKLRAQESESELTLKELRESLTSLEKEKESLKSQLKQAKDSEQQLSLKSKTLQVQLDNEEDSLKEEIKRSQELSKQIEELNFTLIGQKKAASKQSNELKSQIEREKQRVKTIKEETVIEVNRLESKIELLRTQAESVQATTSGNDESYIKLLRQHDTLQQQYTSATENWQSIEASLMHKIANLEAEFSSLQEKSKNDEEKISILTCDLQQKASENEALHVQLATSHSQISKLEAKTKALSSEVTELTEDLANKDIKFNKERAALEFKVKTLEKEANDIVQPQSLLYQPSQEPVISSILTPNSTSTPNLRRSGWDIGFGESSSTPRQSRKSSAIGFQLHTTNSSVAEDLDNNSYFGDNDTLNSPASQFNHSRFENNSNSAIGGSSVQLLGKMSGQVRRLETELSIMREESEKLSEEKKAANEEIVRLMKENEEVQNHKTRVKELEAKVEQYSKRHEKTLEILGEKSEQVEELKADVQDLKDLMRQQVQQLVDLQNEKLKH